MVSIVPMSTDLVRLHMTFNPEGAPYPFSPALTIQKRKSCSGSSPQRSHHHSNDTRSGWNEHGRKEVAAFKTTILDILHKIDGFWGSLLRRIINSTETVNFYPIYRLTRGGIWHTRRCVLLGC